VTGLIDITVIKAVTSEASSIYTVTGTLDRTLGGVADGRGLMFKHLARYAGELC